jgi:glycosyltransferase involved in cell wall biosynthesis
MRISIVIPTLNQARFLPEAIESVLSQQTTAEVECIVVDGGSTDGTLDILREWDPPVRWSSQPDRGQADALNKGLARATGEVIGWLNSDDRYRPGALQRVVDVFSAEPATRWLYGKVRIIDERGREIRRAITAYKNLRMRKFRYRALLAENWISQMGVFWRAEAGRSVGPFRADLHYCMDYDYWLRLGARWPGRFVDAWLADFRLYAESKSGSGFVSQFAEEYQVARCAAAGRYRTAIALHRLNQFRTVAIYKLMRSFGL